LGKWAWKRRRSGTGRKSTTILLKIAGDDPMTAVDSCGWSWKSWSGDRVSGRWAEVGKVVWR
jgi:hypothetical protein